MNASISKDGKELTVTLGINIHESKSGKTMVIATSEGNKSVALTLDGKNIVAKIGVNAYMDK